MAYQRPGFISHWRELEESTESHYPGSDEPLTFGAPLGKALGLTRLGIHHERLLPGRRTCYPHAERDEEEFVHVLQGHPDVWIDGNLHPLSPGDSVAFPCGTGISHTFINNSQEEVHLLVVGEASKAGSKIYYPLDTEFAATRNDRWENPPPRELGPHDGKPSQVKD